MFAYSDTFPVFTYVCNIMLVHVVSNRPGTENTVNEILSRMQTPPTRLREPMQNETP
jgi:hypothetical protein